ncbi:MAG: hypothetical protein ACR2IJ_03290 [Fluviibacter sp.]
MIKHIGAGIAALMLMGVPLAWADIADTPDRTPIAGKTAAGEDVLLFPNGRWEYVNTKKAEEAKKVAEKFPENKVCPAGSQGGLFGFGRCIMPGDKDYNRRSLSGK